METTDDLELLTEMVNKKKPTSKRSIAKKSYRPYALRVKNPQKPKRKK